MAEPSQMVVTMSVIGGWQHKYILVIFSHILNSIPQITQICKHISILHVGKKQPFVP